ncbi:MAG TPA: type II secretion system protein [Candidatus Hydrogenedentes bacterium]|nr:type II secretion system protein [Candidatus Hydrogenedentota bacterium]
MRNRGMSLLELLVILAILGLFAAILLPALAHARGSKARYDCAANLKQLGLASAMFAAEDAHGNYPALYAAHTPFMTETGESTGNSAFLVLPCLNPADLCPEYLNDARAFVCPGVAAGNPAGFDAVADSSGRLVDELGLGLAARSYMYLGWAVDAIAPEAPQEPLGILGGTSTLTAPAQLVLGVGPVLDEVRRSEDPARADLDIPVPGGLGTNGGTTIHRLRKGVERFGVTDINSVGAAAKAEAALWVLADRVTAPEDDGFAFGANVLFKDGHVEFIPFDAKAPVTAGMAAFLDTLALLN